MTVEAAPNYTEYQADGIATSYTIPFKLLAIQDLTVYLEGQLITSGYSIDGIGNQQSQIIFDVAPNGYLLLQRSVAVVRETDYQENGDLRAETLNNDFDRLVMMMQGFDQDNTKSLRVSDPQGINALPIAQIRANKMLAFDENGQPTLFIVEAGSAVDLAKALLNTDNPDKGAGMVGCNELLAYPDKTVGDAIKKLNQRIDNFDTGVPVFSVIWWPLRSSIPNGFIAGDGQELLIADYARAYQGIADGQVPTCTETDWQNSYSAPNNTNKRGCYVLNSSDGKFRIPDYNGVNTGFIQATGAFLRGGINDNEAGVGRTNQMPMHNHESMAIPTATLSASGANDIMNDNPDYWDTSIQTATGRFTITKPNTTVAGYRISTGTALIPTSLGGSSVLPDKYDISNDKPTETYPNHYSGVWIVKIK